MMLLSMTNSEILLKQIVMFRYMKELKIGEKVTITLEAVEQLEGCNGCFFDQGENIPCTYNCKCNRYTRSDHKNIIFKEIKK